jgi:hypothetical protein
MSWWFLGYVLILALFIAPTSASRIGQTGDGSTAFWVLYWLLLGGPASVLGYYCLIRGFQQLGVF